MKDIFSQSMNRDFEEFMAIEPKSPPPMTSSVLLGRIASELNPKKIIIFLKLAVIQTVSGAVTLLFCPQFGISPTGMHGLMQLLSHLGEKVCMFGCGALFIGTSLLVSSMVLRPEEIRVLRKSPMLFPALLSFLALAVFLCLGSEVFESVTAAWILSVLS